MNQCLFTNTITPRPLHTSINYSTSQIGNGSHTFLAGNVRSNSRTYALLQPTPTQVEQSGGGGGGGGAAAACRVKLQTLNGCKLGIGRYPDFEYNAQGGSATGIGIGIEQVDVEFDIHSLYIPPLTYQTTKLLGVPLPPFLTITILPQIFQGIIHQDTGKVELQLTADFNLSMLSLYKPPPLQVETVLTTEEVKTKGEKGQRLDSQGFCKLVGVATILPVNDSFLNAFLDLPTHCIARLSAQILISTT